MGSLHCRHHRPHIHHALLWLVSFAVHTYEAHQLLKICLLQARELADMTGKGKELRARIKELTESLEKEQSATSLATKELQASSVSISSSLSEHS